MNPIREQCLKCEISVLCFAMACVESWLMRKCSAQFVNQNLKLAIVAIIFHQSHRGDNERCICDVPSRLSYEVALVGRNGATDREEVRGRSLPNLALA
jgi:hypothetical protein